MYQWLRATPACEAIDAVIEPSHRALAPLLPPPPVDRRTAVFAAAAVATSSFLLEHPLAASASKLPEAADMAWEAIGGGAADLVFPDHFLGHWDIQSVLVSVDLPQGAEFVPDMTVVQRAMNEDKDKLVLYEAAFMRNPRGQVVPDRRFNTAALMHTYLGLDTNEVASRIAWNVGDPNRLDMSLPGGMHVTTRVTKRLEEVGDAGADRLATSEYCEQVIEVPQRPQPRIKASQTYTKYHWRSVGASEGGPEIVATQVVSDYVTSMSSKDNQALLLGAMGKPVIIYTYRMAFTRKGDTAVAVAVS